MQVRLKVLSGPTEKSEYVFEEAGGFTFGRSSDCTCVMPENDDTFSRHHFILEINPPTVALKDLGSLNGTYVNGTKYGGRAMEVAPKDAKIGPAVDLRDSDKVTAGKFELEIVIDAPTLCVDCGLEIPREKRKAAEFVGGTYLCDGCRKKDADRQKAKRLGVVIGQRSGKPQPPLLNVDQRKRAEDDPAVVIRELFAALLKLPDNERPAEVQGYRDLKEIGRGGFGVVYAATRISDGQRVALKTLLQTRKPPPRQVAIFERELEIAPQLRHPNVVRCERAGKWNDVHFLEMEFVDGGSVFDLMNSRHGRVPLADAAPIMIDALNGLAYAHTAPLTVTTKKGSTSTRGVVHRDLKPPNILLSGAKGRRIAKVADFGLAKAFSEAGMTKGAITASVGSFCGTLPYIAPEHLTNYRYLEPSTDVFEVAATFYHMLTGHMVWPMQPGVEPIRTIMEAKITPIERHLPSFPRTLATIFAQALSRDESHRFEDAGAMLKAMKTAL